MLACANFACSRLLVPYSIGIGRIGVAPESIASSRFGGMRASTQCAVFCLQSTTRLSVFKQYFIFSVNILVSIDQLSTFAYPLKKPMGLIFREQKVFDLFCAEKDTGANLLFPLHLTMNGSKMNNF